MSRTTLKPGDLLMVDPVKSTVVAAPVVVADNGVDLYFQFSPKPWHETHVGGVQGLTAQEAEEVLRGEREYPQVLYKVWDEEAQMPYAPPQSVLDEIERRQMGVEGSPEPSENLGKIKPSPLDLDTPRGGLW